MGYCDAKYVWAATAGGIFQSITVSAGRRAGGGGGWRGCGSGAFEGRAGRAAAFLSRVRGLGRARCGAAAAAARGKKGARRWRRAARLGAAAALTCAA